MSTNVTPEAPPMSPRRGYKRLPTWARTLLALVTTGVGIALLVLVLGGNPFDVFKAIINGSLGNSFNIGQTVTVTAILILTGLAAAIPFSARLWNIGGEGQMTAGAIVAATLGLIIPAGFPHLLFAPLVVICAMAGGAAWAFIPGFLKARFDASEVVTSLMLNFVALFVAIWVISDVFPEGFVQRTRTIADNATLPRLLEGSLVDVGVFLALGAAVAGWVLMAHTRLGFTIRAMGANARAAKLAGIRTNKTTILTFLVAGLFAGLAGGLIVLGRDHSLLQNFSANFGFIGIAVALVARLKPLWIIPSAAVFAILRVGSSSLQAAAGLTPSVGEIIVALFVTLLMVTGVITFLYPESPDAH